MTSSAHVLARSCEWTQDSRCSGTASEKSIRRQGTIDAPPFSEPILAAFIDSGSWHRARAANGAELVPGVSWLLFVVELIVRARFLRIDDGGYLRSR